MRKLMAVFAVLILLCASALAENAIVTPTPRPSEDETILNATAQVAESINRFSETWMAAYVLSEDYAYVLDRDGQLFRWDYSESDPAFVCTLPTYADGVSAKEDAVSLLFADGDTLYALNKYTGRIGTVTENGISWQISFDPDCLLYPDDGERVTYNPIGMNGQLYLLVDYFEENPSADYHCRLLQVDLQTGAYTLSNATDAYRLCSFHHGKLLLMGNDRLMVYDPITGVSEGLDITPVPGGTAMTYDKSANAIYLITDKGVYRSVADDEFTLIANMPGEYAGGAGEITADGRYAFMGGGVWVMRTTAQNTPPPLTVMLHSADPNLQTLFATEYPSILLNWQTNSTMTAADIADAIRSGDTETAVFSVKVDSNFGALVEKGFVSPISNADILSSVSRMYPSLAAPLKNADGEIVAYPWDFGINAWSINQTLWNKYFPGAELPSTWKEFFLLMQAFEQLENENGDLFLMDWDYETMLARVLLSYISRQDQRSEAVDFTNPALMETIAELNKARQVLLDKNVETYSEADIFWDSEVAGDHSVFHYSLGASTRSIYLWNENALPAFVFTEGDEPAYSGSMRVLVINPNSEQKELAEAFIAQLANAEYGVMAHYVFHQDATEPYSQKPYNITNEIIAKWQSATSALRLPVTNPLQSDAFSAQMSMLIERYAAGQLNDQLFLLKLNEIAAMVESEIQ